VSACKSGETSDGDISFEAMNLLGEFEDLPRLDGFVFVFVRSGITQTVVAVTAPLRGGNPVC